MILITVLGTLKGVNDARHFSPIFKAQMTVSPAIPTGISIPSGAGGILGAAQSFGLISGGPQTANSFDHFRQVIGSRSLAFVLQNKHGLMQKVFTGSWDAANGKWIEPNIDRTSIRWRIKRIFHYNVPTVPDIGSLANFVGGMVQVGQIENSPFFSISVEHPDRKLALYLLDTVYREADELLGERDRNKQAQNRKYLEEQLEKSQLVEVRSALLGMVMQQEQKSMLVNVEPPYTIKVLEPPWVAVQPSEPNLARMIGLPAFVSMALCLIVVVVLTSFKME